MLCSKCKKRIAVVFITKMENNQTTNEGICLQCAIEMGIKPVSDMMDKMGISKEDLETVSNELMALGSQDEDENFEEGGNATFPFLQNLFGNGFDGQQLPPPQKKQEKPREENGRRREKDPKRKYLDNYCINLTEKARNGQLDLIVGREKEIYRVTQILNRRIKNNPCLIGEPGVGKTAIAEGVAQRIARGDMPAKLLGKEVYLLDLTALVAGTQFRGQFESRIKGLVDEIKRLGNIILVIDEVHNLVSAGDAEGSMNAANILKPALSRGDIQVIGATTFSEYRRYIEKDSALERRFQPVTVEEPSIQMSVDIIKGIKGYYEGHHGVSIDEETVKQAVLLSERYITDRFLPDKAIDLIDEAGSAANIENDQLTKLEQLNERLSELKNQADADMSDSGSVPSYEKAARLRAEICRVEEDINRLAEEIRPVSISVDRLAEVIELWTGIPASKIKESDFKKLSSLEDRLKRRIVGQDEAISSVCAAIRRNRVGISPKKKPISFIFAGPTGVGKTELVKQLSAELFDSVETMIRLDMSEFMEKHSVSRIIGSPPGYIGYDEAGQLTEKIRRKPYSVVLFDEIEKAHPDVMNILLQVLDEGKITDAHGRAVNFENTILIMTTNAGSDKQSGALGFNQSLSPTSRDKAMKALGDFLRPEFMNRVDEIIVFNPLSEENFAAIADIMLGDLAVSMEEKGIALSWDQDAIRTIVRKSFSIKYGARSMMRTLQKEVEDRVAARIIEASGMLHIITIAAPEGELVVTGS